MSFPYDPSGLATPVFPKSDFAPLGAGDPLKYVTAADWNAFGQALEDLRNAIRDGVYYGLQPQSSDPNPAGITAYVWLDTSGQLHLKSGGTDAVVGVGTAANLSANTTLTKQRVVSVLASGADVTIVLPLAAGAGPLPLMIRRDPASTHNVVVQRQGANTVEGGVSITLDASNASAVLGADNLTAWRKYGSAGTIDHEQLTGLQGGAASEHYHLTAAQHAALGAAAEALGTTGADVNVGAAAPPTTGQALIATSPTTAAWQTISGAPSGAAGGDLGGSYPSPIVDGIQNVPISAPTAQGTQPTYRGSSIVWEDGAPSNQGQVLLPITFNPGANIDTGATGTYTNITSGTVNIPYESDYLVQVQVSGYPTTSGLQVGYRLNFTGPSTVLVGHPTGSPTPTVQRGDWALQFNTSVGERANGTFFAVVHLLPGTYTVQAQYARVFGAGNGRMDGGDSLAVAVIAVGGTASAYSETIADVIQNVSLLGNTSNEAGFPGTVSGGALPSGTFNVPAGGPYTLTLSFNPSYSGSPSGLNVAFRLLVDGQNVTPNGEWQQYIQAGDGIEYVTQRCKVALPAGQHTYALQWRKVSGTGGAQWGSASSNVYRFTLSIDGGAAQLKAEDPIPYQMAYVGASQVSVAPRLGTLLRFHMNDGSIRAHSGTLTADPSFVGSGGLDTGAESVSSWYYLYAVPAGVTDFALRLSLNAPTVGPAGFTVWKYLGAVRNDASGNVVPFVHQGGEFFYQVRQLIADLGTASLAPTDVSLAAVVPNTADLGHLSVGAQRNGVGGGTISFYYQGQTTQLFQEVYVPAESGGVGFDSFTVPLFGAPTRSTRYGSIGGTYINQFVYAHGWRDGFIDLQAVSSFAEVPAPTNQGAIEVFSYTPTGTDDHTAGAGVFQTINAGAVFNFVAPYDGEYLFVLGAEFLFTSTSGDAEFRLLIDGVTTVPGAAPAVGASWYMAWNFASQHASTRPLMAKTTLTKGAHTIAVQWTRYGSAGTLRMVATDGLQLAVFSPGGNAQTFYQLLASGIHGGAGSVLGSSATTGTGGWVAGPVGLASVGVGAGTGSVINVPATGKYRFNLRTQLLNGSGVASNWGHVAFKVQIDGVDATPNDSSAANFGWTKLVQAAGGHDETHLIWEIQLTAGTHTWQVFWKNHTVAGTPNIQSDGNDRYTVWLEGGSAVQRAQDQTPYKITWAANDQVQVGALQGTTLILHLNDGFVRQQAGPLTLDLDTDLDTGAKAASTWYAIYAVPSAAATGLTLKASLNFPTSGVGPSGFTSYKYLGAIRTDGSSNILKFFHSGNEFRWTAAGVADGSPQQGLTEPNFPSGTTTIARAVPGTDYTLLFVPPTAAFAFLNLLLRVDGSGGDNSFQALHVEGMVEPYAVNSCDNQAFSIATLADIKIPLPGAPTKKVGYSTYEDNPPPEGNDIAVQYVGTSGWVDQFIDQSLGVQVAGGGGSSLLLKDEGTAFGAVSTSLDVVGGRVAATDLGSQAAQLKVAREVPPETVATQNITGTNTTLTDLLDFVPVATATGSTVKLYFNTALCPQSWYSVNVATRQITWNAASAAPNMTTLDSLVAVYETMS